MMQKIRTVFPGRKKTERLVAASRLRGLVVASTLSLAVLGSAQSAQAYKFPDIFFLGDSHLSFGAGAVFRDLFKNFDTFCRSHIMFPRDGKAIADMRFGLMGVKATSIHSWVARRWSRKKMVCEPDPKWPVNARLYGFKGRRDGSYIQIGRDPKFPFCRKEKSPFEAMFADPVLNPKLLVLYFTGNALPRWSRAPRLAQADVKNLMKQLPANMPCIFMTTSPVYKKKHNNERLAAQKNIGEAFKMLGERCKFVPMITAETRKEIEGNARYFRRRKNGRVKDPYHPNAAAARFMIKAQAEPFCRAVVDSLRPKISSSLSDAGKN